MKNHYLIEDYFLDDYSIIVFFGVNQEICYRKLEIDIDDFDKYLDDCGHYEMSEDCWDYGSESHYTRDWQIGFDEYWNDYVDPNHIVEFMEEHFLTNPLPELEEE